VVAKKQLKPDYYYQQSAILPYRVRNGRIEVLLITSLKKKKWIIPKGIIEVNTSAVDSAAKEAFEEAGITGKTDSSIFDIYEVSKWGGICRVEVYLMQIEEIFDDWPEKIQRKRKLFDVEEAALSVDNIHLKGIIRDLGDKLSDGHRA